ncbi:MAG: ferrochelatase, partial [Acidimicrobiales bacterium]
AYGTPAIANDVEAYYTHVRRGRPPTPELLADLQRRYRAIGGTSPLRERTEAQAAGLAAALGDGFDVELGMKHAPPFLEEAVETLASRAVERAVGLVLAPHYSALSVGEYEERIRAAAAGRFDIAMVRSWHDQEGYLDLLSRRLTEAAASVAARAPVHVLFTAHSLPARILGTGDPYPEQLAGTASAVARRAGLEPGSWSVAWQSAGRTPEPWIGPDLLTVLPRLAADGVGSVVVCPAGFVSDHLEVLYDLDVEAAGVARDLGLAFTRTASLNDGPSLCLALAEVVRRHA